MRAIQLQEFGGPEVLRLVELPAPVPADGEVLVEVSRAGMNFADTHQRENSYLARATLPLIPGTEVAGVRADTGERVIALCGSGGYAEQVAVHEALVYPIPDEVDGTETYPAGTLAMANTGAPDSGGGQFFIVFGDSSFPPSYTVWGQLDEASLATLVEATASGNDAYWESIGSSGGRPNTPVTFEGIDVGADVS